MAPGIPVDPPPSGNNQNDVTVAAPCVYPEPPGPPGKKPPVFGGGSVVPVVPEPPDDPISPPIVPREPDGVDVLPCTCKCTYESGPTFIITTVPIEFTKPDGSVWQAYTEEYKVTFYCKKYGPNEGGLPPDPTNDFVNQMSNEPNVVFVSVVTEGEDTCKAIDKCLKLKCSGACPTKIIKVNYEVQISGPPQPPDCKCSFKALTLVSKTVLPVTGPDSDKYKFTKYDFAIEYECKPFSDGEEPLDYTQANWDVDKLFFAQGKEIVSESFDNNFTTTCGNNPPTEEEISGTQTEWVCAEECDGGKASLTVKELIYDSPTTGVGEVDTGGGGDLPKCKCWYTGYEINGPVQIAGPDSTSEYFKYIFTFKRECKSTPIGTNPPSFTESDWQATVQNFMSQTYGYLYQQDFTGAGTSQDDCGGVSNPNTGCTGSCPNFAGKVVVQVPKGPFVPPPGVTSEKLNEWCVADEDSLSLTGQTVEEATEENGCIKKTTKKYSLEYKTIVVPITQTPLDDGPSIIAGKLGPGCSIQNDSGSAYKLIGPYKPAFAGAGPSTGTCGYRTFEIVCEEFIEPPECGGDGGPPKEPSCFCRFDSVVLDKVIQGVDPTDDPTIYFWKVVYRCKTDSDIGASPENFDPQAYADSLGHELINESSVTGDGNCGGKVPPPPPKPWPGYGPPEPPYDEETAPTKCEDAWICQYYYITTKEPPISQSQVPTSQVPGYSNMPVDIVEKPSKVDKTNPYGELAPYRAPGFANEPITPGSILDEQQNSLNYLKPEYEIYDEENNILFTSNRNLTSSIKNSPKSSLADPNNILKDDINSVLKEILENQEDENIPYNGLTSGKFFTDPNLIEDSLSLETLKLLGESSTYNVASLNLSSIFLDSLKYASINGVFSDYSKTFFSKIIEEAKGVYPEGLPTISQDVGQNIVTGYEHAIKNKYSLDPKNYIDGDSQKIIQRYRVLPEDIDLTIPVQLQDGTITGVRFANDDSINVIDVDGNSNPAKHENEFFKIINSTGQEEVISLLSNRDKAYFLHYSDESVVQALASPDQNTKLEYRIDLIASSSTLAGANDDIETVGGNQTIPEALLFSSVRESIKEVEPPNSAVRSTEVDYNLAWSTNEPNFNKFNSTVKEYSGPRMSFYLPSNDPIWNIILEGGTLKLKFTDFSLPLEDNIYVRKILTDFIIYPTDVTEYNAYQGFSNLSNYTKDEPVERSLTLILNPYQSIQEEGYTQTSPTRNTPSGKVDVFGFQYINNFKYGEPTEKHSKKSEDLNSGESSLGTLFNTISEIDSNYDLTNASKGKLLPENDVLSLLTFKQYINLIKSTPKTVIYNTYKGTFNNIKLIKVRSSDTEKTFLTEKRRTGVDLTALKKRTSVLKNSNYFDPKYKGILFRR